MKMFNYGLLFIAALALSFTSCKKEKNNPPAGGGGGGSSSTGDCCVCDLGGFNIVACPDDYTSAEWDQLQADFDCDCSTSTAGFVCESGDCNMVSSGADYFSSGACQDACSGGGEHLVPSSGNNSITTCYGVIKDHAGDGDYENNINGYTIINPSMTGYNVELSFTSFALEDCCDFVTIFDGAGTNGAELFSGNGTTIPPTITATNGPLTIRHTSDVSITNSGFAANITCVPGSSSDTFDCISGNCMNVGSGGTYATQADCEANCGASTEGYNCVSGNCQFVSSGAQFGTLADCQNSCGGSTDCCDCTGVGFVCDVCCDGEFDMLGESWSTWVQLFEQSGCNCE